MWSIINPRANAIGERTDRGAMGRSYATNYYGKNFLAKAVTRLEKWAMAAH